MRVVRAALFVILAVAVLPSPARAQGGPPLITDDPDTPGPGFWEINIGMLLEKTGGERRLETPRVDLNYGVGRRIQLKFEMPWVVNQRDGQTETAAGDGIVGVKWRFIGQEGERIAWSIYPQFEFNTASRHTSTTR